MNRYLGYMVVDILLPSFPVSIIIKVDEYGFYTDYIPDHFYAWRDENKEWKFYIPDVC